LTVSVAEHRSSSFTSSSSSAASTAHSSSQSRAARSSRDDIAAAPLLAIQWKRRKGRTTPLPSPFPRLGDVMKAFCDKSNNNFFELLDKPWQKWSCFGNLAEFNTLRWSACERTHPSLCEHSRADSDINHRRHARGVDSSARVERWRSQVRADSTFGFFWLCSGHVRPIKHLHMCCIFSVFVLSPQRASSHVSLPSCCCPCQVARW
jgi:hypothetical protein